eukprot:5920277-Amphidinium_carterae.1
MLAKFAMPAEATELKWVKGSAKSMAAHRGCAQRAMTVNTFGQESTEPVVLGVVVLGFGDFCSVDKHLVLTLLRLQAVDPVRGLLDDFLQDCSCLRIDTLKARHFHALDFHAPR